MLDTIKTHKKFRKQQEKASKKIAALKRALVNYHDTVAKPENIIDISKKIGLNAYARTIVHDLDYYQEYREEVEQLVLSAITDNSDDLDRAITEISGLTEEIKKSKPTPIDTLYDALEKNRKNILKHYGGNLAKLKAELEEKDLYKDNRFKKLCSALKQYVSETAAFTLGMSDTDLDEQLDALDERIHLLTRMKAQNPLPTTVSGIARLSEQEVANIARRMKEQNLLPPTVSDNDMTATANARGAEAEKGPEQEDVQQEDLQPEKSFVQELVSLAKQVLSVNPSANDETHNYTIATDETYKPLREALGIIPGSYTNVKGRSRKTVLHSHLIPRLTASLEKDLEILKMQERYYDQIRTRYASLFERFEQFEAQAKAASAEVKRNFVETIIGRR